MLWVLWHPTRVVGDLLVVVREIGLELELGLLRGDAAAGGRALL